MLNLNLFQQQQSIGAKPKLGAQSSAIKSMQQANPAQDQFGAFLAQMEAGKIKPNVNAPGLPHTASRSWNA